MTKRVWIIWVAIELAAVLMLAALWPANASAPHFTWARVDGKGQGYNYFLHNIL